MVLSNEELKKIYTGAYCFEETEDGYLKSCQYSKAQMDYFKGAFQMWYERCDAGSGKTIEFITDATQISFEYKFTWICSKDTFEVWEDDLATGIVQVEGLAEEGKLCFDLSEGRKKVSVYLPVDATVLIKNFELSSRDYEPVKKGTKVLWLGDSITQGYGPLRSAHTYVNVANRLLNYDIINQGIGGYVYDKKSLMKMEGYTPEKIIVSLGTNQYGTESMKDIEEYYEVLTELYKDIPILCITPLWRGDNPEGLATLVSFCGKIKKIVEKYDRVTVVDGFKLVPHMSEYFLDNLHPNQLGAFMYGMNLVKEIEKGEGKRWQ